MVIEVGAGGSPDPQRELVERLRSRGNSLRLSAQAILLLILLSLGAGLYLFIYAGQITVLDFRKSLLDAEIKTLGELGVQVRNIEDDARRAENRGQFLSPQASREAEQAYVQALKGASDSLRALNTAAQVAATRSPQPESNARLMASTITTRVGSVLILLFLVQILVSLYRYNLRLAAFYDARADALEMKPKDSRELRFLATLFSPIVDFGKMPASPAEHLITAARDMAAAGIGAKAKRLSAVKVEASED